MVCVSLFHGDLVVRRPTTFAHCADMKGMGTNLKRILYVAELQYLGRGYTTFTSAQVNKASIVLFIRCITFSIRG